MERLLAACLVAALLTGAFVVSSPLNAIGLNAYELPVELGSPAVHVKSTISAGRAVDYIVKAYAGQRMSVRMSTDSGANYFNVLPPDSERALAIGSVLGNSWSGVLPSDGGYRIRVYLQRAAVRRHESARFVLSVELHDGGSKGHSIFHDAQRPVPLIHAKGMVPCSVGTDPKQSARCAYGLIRHGTRCTELRLALPGNELVSQTSAVVVLHFDGSRLIATNITARVQAELRGGDWEVAVDEFYFFTIPDVLIRGARGAPESAFWGVPGKPVGKKRSSSA